MLGMAAIPPRLIVGALLAVCMLPQCSSITVMREEISSNTTISKSELKAMLKVARADLQAEMRKSGMAVSDPGTATNPSQPNPGRLLTGRRYNCAQTVVTATEPIWSMVEAIAAAVDSCKNTKTECDEATLSVTEASLGLITYILDFPTDCMGRTCGKKAENEERIDPMNFGLTMLSGGLDFVTAGVGAAAGSLSVWLQCKKKLGDSLGLLESEKPSPWLHPSMVSFVPSVKDIRENWQAWKGSDTETPNQRAEKKWAALERAVGMAQSIMETLMHEHNQGGSPDTTASAADGCIAAYTHIVASAVSLLTSWYKSAACWRGELELAAAIDGWDYGEQLMGQEQSGRNKGPKKPKNVVEPKNTPISGGGVEETMSGSGTGNRNSCHLVKDKTLADRCFEFAMQYQNRKSDLSPSAKNCQKMCCDAASYLKELSHDSKMKRILTKEEYCTAYTEGPRVTRVQSAPIYKDDSNMARDSHREKTKRVTENLRQKSVAHQFAVSPNAENALTEQDI